MKSAMSARLFVRSACCLPLGLALIAPPYLCAQEKDDPSPPNGWRRFDEPPQPNPPPAPPVAPPGEIVLPAGTWITIRVNDPLSSDQNRVGDLFTGTLAQPLVMDGFVVARRGQTVAGRITDVEKAGRFKGTSRLGLELVEVGIVDGRQMQVRTELIQYSGGTSLGRDATAIGTTAGLGAAIGAAADGGFGAGVGALSGAAASTIGVLLTRGRATIVDPEAAITFRTLTPVSISTERAEHAFQRVRQEDYEPRQLARRATSRRGPPPPPFFYSGYWPYSPFFYGPGFFYSRPVFIRSRGYHGRR